MTDNIDPYLLEINYIINKIDNKITKYVFNKVKKNRNSIWNGQWFLFQLKKILLDFVINDKEHEKEIEQMISNNDILLFLKKNNYINKLKNNIYKLESKIELNNENDIIKYGFDKNLVPNGKIDIYGNIITINSSIFFIPLTEKIIEEKDEEKVEKKINKKPKKPRIKAEKEEKKNIKEDDKARKKAEEKARKKAEEKARKKAEKEKEKARKKAEKEQTEKFKKIKKKFKKEKFNENFVNLWVTLNSIFDDYKSPNEYQIKDLFSMMKKATENMNEKDKYLFNENWRQEDAGEFLNTLFDILNDNIQHNNKIINTLKNINSIECDGYKNTYPINYLNKLRIPNKFLRQNKELSEIINEVTNEVEEVKYDNCDNGKAIKNTIYQTVGDYLIVELIKYNNEIQRIDDKKIQIKISDTINIKDENKEDIKFNLVGTINHLGVNMNSGHYTSYIKKNTNEYEWYHCDDNKIKGYTKEEIFTFMKTNKPYIIFYERENIKKNGNRNRKPFGINNFGNTCFCNAVLQNLFNINEFKNLVTKLPKKKEGKKCDKDKLQECLKKGKVCNEETGRCKEKKEKKSEIAFKSSPRSKWPFFLLSNFYGGSEFTYMSQRTTNSNLKKLYLKLRDMDMNYESFKNYRIKLQPSSKNKYEKPTYKDPYYYKDEDGTVFIGTGLIAKLISGSYKQEKRLKIVNEIAVRLDLEGNIKKEDFIDGTLKDKKKWMMNALKLKFKDSFYEDILLKTNNSDIYELKSGRDKNSMWAGKTGLLGKLLIKVRKNLKQKGVKGGNLPSWYNDLIKFI